MSHKLTQEEFLRRAKEVHGNKYCYDKSVYIDLRTPLIIKCVKHGNFVQEPRSHLIGADCPKCGRLKAANSKTSNGSFYIRAKEKFGDSYSYDKTNYINGKTKVIITCKKHGDFLVKPAKLLCGQGCPGCLKDKQIQESKDYFFEAAKKVHGTRYTYDLFGYTNMQSKIVIFCKIHGKFTQKAVAHSAGNGCPKCSAAERGKKRRLTINNIQNKLKDLGEYLSLDNAKFIKDRRYLRLGCEKHGKIEVLWGTFKHYPKCPHCNFAKSRHEDLIEQWLLAKNINFKRRDRTILDGNELDFYLPDHNLAIEVNGLYWHSEAQGKDKNYHLNKTNLCAGKGVRLIHIFENEFINSEKIVKSKIYNALGTKKYKIDSNVCDVIMVNKNLGAKFLNKYHLDGNYDSDVMMGLIYRNRLVSLLCVSKNYLNYFEIDRFCNIFNFDINGSFNKLFYHFESIYNPIKISTEINKRWSIGKNFLNNGFNYKKDSCPRSWYFKDSRDLYSKKPKIKQKLYKIWDCGNILLSKDYV